jgi:hypothetical protein
MAKKLVAEMSGLALGTGGQPTRAPRGGRQSVAGHRTSKARQIPVTEIAYYVGSRLRAELSDKEMLAAIVGHWEVIGNGTHRVRDVSMGEDACRVANPKAARNMVTLRNLARKYRHNPMPTYRAMKKSDEMDLWGVGHQNAASCS